MKKEVEILVGVPCSGKSTYLRKTYKEDEVFVISRDDIRNEIIEGTDFKYSDFFVKPKEGETEHSLYGVKTEEGGWSNIEKLNLLMTKAFEIQKLTAAKKLEEGVKVVVDLVNMMKTERDEVKSWFAGNEGVEFTAVEFNYKDNMKLIETQLEKRGKEEDKSIPFFIVEKMIEASNPIEEGEFTQVKQVDGLEGLKPAKRRKLKR